MGHAIGSASRTAELGRHEKGVRPRTMRRVHRSDRRPAHEFLSRPSRFARRRGSDDHRRDRRGRRPTPAAGRVHRARCLSMRLLHAGPDMFWRGAPERRTCPFARGDPRANERQPLPVRRLHQHRGCHRRRPAASNCQFGGRRVNRFDYIRPESVADAVAALAGPGVKILAGGTNLVDLMKYDVARPSRIVDINRLPLKSIEDTEAGGLRIGALVGNSDLAWHPQVVKRYPLLSSAILAGASPEPRNAATTGGNLLQRTRCYYFYDTSTPCNKRKPGSGCSAIGGLNRIHAILGASDACIAVHPSDMCVALAALDAEVEIEGPRGKRSIPFPLFHRLPDQSPERDNTLEPGELVVAIILPPSEFGRHQ